MSFFSTRWLAGALVATLVGLSLSTPSCTYSHGEPVPCITDTTSITYAAVVSPIIQANCLDCHNTANYQNDGDFQNFDQFTVLQSHALSGQLMRCLRHEPSVSAMPKGRAKLSDCDIARIQAWVDAGALNN
ncbi:hypothetical protein Q5H93_07780 [Hymenobacter sp. ASUV-10]|uniref:Cytochrome c domain-containing protein n=1 Tax=Hymenobacter aranciens TaxID=3063996 RepID=A0ABT9BAE8_9BACT|nr:hypothetical protein [Hymenobacter sp. ASUV-10]MDO7874628.1 hypothetical protein [Hymenobacter sp. ASUV-10]